MGYTHYWYKIPSLDPTKFKVFLKEFNIIKHEFEDLLEIGRTDENILIFNGIGDDGHETFVFEQIADQSGFTQYEDDETKSRIFNFCKTAEKPYDIAVCSALIIAKKIFGDDVKISSDGDYSDWTEAQSLCSENLGYGKIGIDEKDGLTFDSEWIKSQ